MKNPLSICFVSPQIAPFVQKSELAEVAAQLPIALKEMGHDVRVMMPNYKSVNERKYVLRDVIRLRDMSVQLGEQEIKVSAKSSFLPDSKVQVYFLDNKDYFGRPDIYVDPATGKPFPDNDERFAAFCLGCLQTLRVLHWQPDIIHCFDWPAGLLPIYLKTVFADEAFFAKTKFVFTFSRYSSYAEFSAESPAKIGLPQNLAETAPELFANGKFNVFNAGISSSDLVVLGSESLVQEMLEEDLLPEHVRNLLRLQKTKLVGMVNGINYKNWDPETDKYLAMNYSGRSISRKVENKKILLDKIGLHYSAEIPLIAYLSGYSEEKGAGLVLKAIDELLKLPSQIVVLDAGDGTLKKEFEKKAKKAPRQVAFAPKSTEIQHLLLAGADMAVFPAKHESLGTDAFRCLRYGTIPVAHASGVYKDSIVPFDAKAEQGAGFLFEEETPAALVQAVKQAVAVYKDAKKWQKLVRNALKENHSWESVATRFSKLYQKIASQKK